jgi:general stress protein YciG
LEEIKQVTEKTRLKSDFELSGKASKTMRGFAALTPEQRRRIASLGGRAAHAKGVAHRWSSRAAAIAGRKGGLTSRGGKGRLL